MNILSKQKKKKVIVGLSGGVDSSVAAALLKEQGFDVQGVFMKNFDPVTFFGKQAEKIDPSITQGCHWREDQEDARAVAEHLGIPFAVWNFEKEYYAKVMDYFLSEYKSGRTPNPDVMCNKQVKFGAFFDKAMKQNVDFIATGHYARNRFNQEEKGYELLKGLDDNKDQSYFLYAIDQKSLAKTLFPLGALTKKEVRKIADDLNLPTKNKKDSQGICFVGEISLPELLKQYIKETPGDIIDLDSGEVVGRHEGLSWYTVGQRKGMAVGGTGLPLYVAGKDLAKNELYVVKGNYNPKLFRRELIASELSWINKIPDFPQDLQVKIRYRQQDQDAKVDWFKKGKSLHVTFIQDQRAVTPGQSVVFYNQDVCLGGGIINEY